jgi:hypothetical protein
MDKEATVVAGGGRPDHAGALVQATILTDVTPDMRAYSEELFGPAAVVEKVKDADEAVALANSSAYGLAATVMSADPDRAQSVADRPEAGMVWINQPTGSSPELAFGGVKRSGYGRELSELAMSEFLNRRLLRTVPRPRGPTVARPGQHACPDQAPDAGPLERVRPEVPFRSTSASAADRTGAGAISSRRCFEEPLGPFSRRLPPVPVRIHSQAPHSS